MIKFQRITIENYKTIGYAEIDFEPGVYRVVGQNNDSRYTSNGSGKTTVVQALVVALYNRDLSGVNLEYLSNRTNSKPFRIIVDFEVNTNGELKQVKVVHDRSDTKKLKVFIDGEIRANGTTVALPLIESLIGMGFETFKFTHYITSSTITELTQNLSQPTLFNDILHIVELNELDKKLLKISKDVQSQLDEVSSKLNRLVEQEKILALQNRYDKGNLEIVLDITKEELELLESRFSAVSVDITEGITSTKDSISKVEQSIKQMRASLKNGVCSMCNTVLVDKESLIQMNTQLVAHEESNILKQAELDSLESKYRALNKKYIDAKQELTGTISKTEQELSISLELEALNSRVSIDDKLTLIDTKDILESESTFIQSARKEIKAGKVIKSTLDKFFIVIKHKLNIYSQLINLEHFKIDVKNDKQGMVVVLTQGVHQIPIDTLSNGEKTRLSLLVLISMLDAMKSITEADTNFLVFDEASSSFDKSGIGELEKLFAYLRELNQSVFLITHGSELDSVHFNRELLVTKTNGVSTVSIGDVSC